MSEKFLSHAAHNKRNISEMTLRCYQIGADPHLQQQTVCEARGNIFTY